MSDVVGQMMQSIQSWPAGKRGSYAKCDVVKMYAVQYNPDAASNMGESRPIRMVLVCQS